MKKYIVVYIFFLLNFITITAFADSFEGKMTYPLSGDIEVTSEFGWRTHPIFGTEIFHAGVDFGADYGESVYAAAAGVVTTADWVSGYGNAIYIDHGEGVQTVYGHNEYLLVTEGAFVQQGQPIALAGSTGNSTGPHCHFEVDVNGQPVDPALYLNGLPPGNGNNFLKSDYNLIPINFDAYFDFAKPMREVIAVFAEQCTKGLKIVKDKLKWLFMALVTIDLAYGAMIQIYDPTGEKSGYIKWLLYKVLFYGFLMFMLFNWGDMVANTIRDYFGTMGALALGNTEAEAANVVSDPTQIVQMGAKLIAPIFSFLGTFSGTAILKNIPLISISMIFAFLIMLCFCLVGLQIMMAYIEFYMVVLFSFVTFTFSGYKHSRRYAANGLNGLFMSSIKLMFFCIFAIIMSSTMQSIKVDDYYTTATATSSSTMTHGQIISDIDQFMAAIRQVESGGDYTIPSADGYGYGAYQISYVNWDNWCAEAGVPVPADWTPENQDTVARCIMLERYSAYGNWHDVAVSWNGGGGAVGQGWSSTELYWSKVENALGHSIDRSLNILLLFKLLLVAFAFVYFGSRLSKTILKEFGGRGFEFQ